MKRASSSWRRTSCHVSDTQGPPPPLVIENARVRTLDAAGTVADAIAIRDGRIVAVGTRDEARGAVTAGARRLDLAGNAVLPGFIDGHVHYQKAAIARRFTIDFLELAPRTIQDVLTLVAEATSGTAAGAWIRGDALDQRRLAERRYPTRWELDAVAPDHAIVLLGVGNHAIAANSLALARAGIDRETQDPPGGRLDRTEDGEITGVLRELGKLRLDPNRPDSVLPGVSDDQRLEAVAAGFDHLLANGITSIHDIVMDPGEIGAYMRLHAAGRLRQRVRFIVRGYEARTSLDDVIGLGLRHDFGDAWLRYSGVKLSIDGACGERNAATYDAYPGEPWNTGLVRIPQDVLDELVARAHAHGVRLAVHAIGPRAVDMALDAFERTFASHGRGDLRHRIEHAYLPPAPRQLERLAAADLLVSTQPAFFWEGDGWTSIWDPGELTDVMPLRSMREAGVRVMGGTDYPNVPIAPLPGLAAMVDRRQRDGTVLGPGQSIGMDEALRLQTTAAAWGAYDEHLLGSIEVGKLADLVVLSEDPVAVPPGVVRDTRTLMTILDGEVAYEA